MTSIVSKVKIEFYEPFPQKLFSAVFERIKEILAVLEWDKPDFRTAETHLKDRKCSVLLAKENEEIVGYSILVPTIRQIHLLQIAIHPSHQGKGLGTSLMDRVIQEVWRKNRPTLTLFTEYEEGQKRFYGKYLERYSGTVKRLNPNSVLCTFFINNKEVGTKEVALHEVVAKGDHVGLQALVQSGIDQDAKADESFDTPLHIAAEKGDLESVRALLDAGADIHAKQFQGATPLHKAAKFGQIEVIELLVERGANVDALCFQEFSALHWAAFFGRTNCVEELMSRGVPFSLNPLTPLILAAYSGHFQVVGLLARHAASLKRLTQR